MKIHRRPYPSTILPVATLASLALTSCEVLYPLQTGERRHTVEVLTTKTPGEGGNGTFIKSQQASEKQYITLRRTAAKVHQERTLGIALSGGGVRSANYNLGTLQGLEDAGLLRHVDYLSCVSGGGYIGGWYVSHLRSEAEMKEIKGTSFAHRTQFSSNRRQLLNLEQETDCGAVDYLRDRSGLFGHQETKAWNLIRSITFFGATFGPNFIQDFVVHLQPSPGKWNALHPFYSYRRLLHDTYLDGWQVLKHNGVEGPLLNQDINSPGSETPFLILNGALGNLHDLDGDKDPERLGSGGIRDLIANCHFEFTRDWCGSPDLGWIPTEYFDRTVDRVKRTADGRIYTTVLKSPTPIRMDTLPLRLSTAMAASGAAFDSVAVSAEWKGYSNTALTAFNLNLRYQTANFAQNFSAPALRPIDRLREVTSDRFTRQADSNTLQISDGGHFDNLGAFALLRRQVDEIYIFDATKDAKYGYGDLRKLLQRIDASGWRYEIAPGQWHQPPGRHDDPSKQSWLPAQLKMGETPLNPIWDFRVDVRGKISEVHYVKNSFRPDDHCSRFATAHPSLYALNPDVDPTVVPKNGEKPGPNIALTSSNFPHVGTFKLDGWNQPMFDAYRELGRYLARRATHEAAAAGGMKGDKPY